MSNKLREFEKRYEHDVAIAKLRAERPETPDNDDEDGQVLPISSFNAIIESKVEVPEYDRLADLFKSTKGEKWKRKKKWDLKPNREGVMVEREGIKFADYLEPETNLQVVEEIELESNFMQGILPESVGFFAGLKKMTLKMNNISRAIPSSISNLSSLVFLDLSQNSFQMKLPKQFPQSLTTLNLSQNRLTGEIPEQFSILSSLVELNLNSNRLTGGIPECLSTLHKLQILDVGRNGLDTYLPLNIAPGITNLTHLDLSENQIGGSIPINFSLLSKLRFFSIHDNDFLNYKDTLERSLGGMTTLTELDISKNQFFGRVPACLARMTSLHTLDISENYFEGPLPLAVIAFQQRRRNTTLRLDKNKDLCLPKNMGVLGLGIVELNLSGAGIRGALPASFGDLIYLRSLEMPHNRLSGEIPESLKSLEQLEVLDLSDNDLSSGFLPCFASWVKLQVLDIKNNANFDPAIPNELSTLKDLKVLNLSGCKYSHAKNKTAHDKHSKHLQNDIVDKGVHVYSIYPNDSTANCEGGENIIGELNGRDKNAFDDPAHDARLYSWIPQHAEDYLKAFNLAVTIETLGNCVLCGQLIASNIIVPIEKKDSLIESEESKLLLKFAEEDAVWKNKDDEYEDDPDLVEPEDIPFPELPDSTTSIPDVDGSFKAKFRGETAQSEKKYEEAIKNFTEALIMSAPVEDGLKAMLYRVQLLSKRAQCLMALKRPMAVIRDCTTALTMNNQNGALLSLRGTAYRQVGEWELAKVDLSASMTINCDPQLVPLIDIVNDKVAVILEERAAEEEKQRIRAKLLDQARMKDEMTLGILLNAEEEDGFRGGADKKSLRFDLRGEVDHLQWLGDVTASGKNGGIAGGISRMGEACCHDTFTNYLIRVDIRGHVVSDKGVLEVVKALKFTSSVVTFRASQNGIDFDVSREDLPSCWRLYSFPANPTKLDENRDVYLSNISSPLQLEILARVIYARPKVLNAKVDIRRAYSGVRNAKAKSVVIIDPSSVTPDKSSGFLVYGRIKVAFIIAVLIEPNPLLWMDCLNIYENELWFALVTAAKGRKYIANGQTLNYYLDPLGFDWEEELCKKIDILVASRPNELVFAQDFRGRRALDVASPKIKHVMSRYILLAGRYLLDSIAMPPPATALYQSARSLVLTGTDLHQEDDYGLHSRVAVKLMVYEADFRRELLARERFKLDGAFVAPVLEAHVPSTGIDTWKSVHPSIDAVLEVPTSLFGFDAFYFLVMPLADQDLMQFLESFSSKSTDLSPLLSAMRDTMNCVKYVHSRGLIHANIDATNVVRFGKTWKLIDMDFVTEMNDVMTLPRILSTPEHEDGIFHQGAIKYWRKVPMYLPPEIVKIESQFKVALIDGCLHDRWDRSVDSQWKRWAAEHQYGETENTRSKSKGSETSVFAADVSFDLWQLGCLAYHILHRKRLMAVDHIGNPTLCATHDGRDEEISTLFDLRTWDIIRSRKIEKKCVGYEMLQGLMEGMLKYLPSERSALQVSPGKSVKQFHRNSPVGRLEKYLNVKEYGLEGCDDNVEFEQPSVESSQSEVEIRDQKFFRFSEEVGNDETIERRSYYLQNLVGPTQTKLHMVLELFGRSSPLERNFEDVERSTLNKSETPQVIKTRNLKRLIAAERTDYPTAFVLTTPMTSCTPIDDPVRWVNNYVHYIAPILRYPVVDERNLTRMSAQEYVAAKAKEKEDKANAPPKYEPTTIDLPPYLHLNLVCEMCFQSASDDIWPAKVSLMDDDITFLRKISPLANATFKAAHKIFSGMWDVTPEGGLEMYDGGYVENMLQFLGFRNFDKLYMSKDSSTIRMDLAHLLSCSSDLRALVRQNDQMMQKSIDDALSFKKRRRDEDLIMKNIFHLIAQLETNTNWETFSDMTKFLRRNHPMNRDKAIIGKKIKKIESKASVERRSSQEKKVTKSVSFQDLNDAVSDESPSSIMSSPPTTSPLMKLEFANQTFSRMDEKVQGLLGRVQPPDKTKDDKFLIEKGCSAREFKAFLLANDPDSCLGGLKRLVLPSGHSVWLCTACFLNTVGNDDTKNEMQMVEGMPKQEVVISNSIDANIDEIRKVLGR